MQYVNDPVYLSRRERPGKGSTSKRDVSLITATEAWISRRTRSILRRNGNLYEQKIFGVWEKETLYIEACSNIQCSSLAHIRKRQLM